MLSFRLSLIWILAALPLATASAQVQAQGQPAPAAMPTSDPPILPPPPSVLLPQDAAQQIQPPVAPPTPPPSGLVAPVPPQLPPKAPFIEFTTMRMMLEKGYISQAEFDSAMRDLGVSIGSRGADSMTLVVGKIATTVYGFAQADVMYHSTQSFNDYAGNLQIARPGTFSGDHGRTEFSARDSRFGFRLQAPATPWLRASALLEMDFLGPSGTIGSTTTEAAFFNNPLLRIRHAYLKLETPIVDILFGHYWHLFGWQPSYVPADVQWSGVVGSLFSRTMQLRISKTVKTSAVTLDFAIAGMRPPQRDSSIPEFEAGARIAFNKWTGVHTLYVTSTQVMPASIGISGDLRRFSMQEFSAAPKRTNDRTSLGFAVDAFLPIIPIRNGSRDNSLSIVGEFVTGQSINDLYVGLNGGVASPALPGMNGAAGGTFNPDVDAGLAVYDVNGDVRLPHWMTFIVGAEYYPPKVDGRIGLFVNFARTQLMDSNLYANPGKVRDNEMFYNGGIFGDLSAAVRLGIDYAYYDDQYVDGVHATTHAVQGTGFFFF